MIEKNKDVILKAWFALYTKSRSEFKAEEQINAQQIECYLPTIVKYKQWSDRKKRIVEPLIRGYIFIFADEKERIISLEQNAVVRCLTERGRPAKIPGWQIDNLKNMLRNEADFYITEGLIPGTKVRIKEGPFEDVIGVIKEIEGGRTIAVTIDLLNRSVIAHLPRESIFEVVK
jgi:transcriptional antiterminator RfaH